MRDNPEDRVLILASTGRDAPLLREALEEAGIGVAICDSPQGVAHEILNGAAAIVLTQESLGAAGVNAIANAIRMQPSWSDLPVLILMPDGAGVERANGNLAALDPLGNITLLDRPLRATTLLSVVKTALRARMRQYEIRDHLLERSRTAAELARNNEDLRQFAMVAAHDLQEPIRTVASFAQLLGQRYRGRLDEDADEFIDYIVGGAYRMGRLVEDLLTFAQLSTRTTVLSAQDSEAMLETALFNLAAKLRESGAEVTHGSLPRVMADQMQIVQVFQNLISNAIKYRSAERPKIRVTATENGPDWIFAVEDNGIGFKQEYAERIFGLFKRLHGRDIPGTGIGLANCRKILERHGRRIWAVSEEGKGATFFFTLAGAAAKPAEETSWNSAASTRPRAT